MEGWHKIIFLVMGLVVLSSLVSGVESKIAAEELRIDLLRYDPSLNQGSYSDVVFEITNIGDKGILSKEITLVDEFPFSAKDRSVTVTNLEPGKKVQVKFNVFTNKDVDDGTYSLSIQYYSDKQGVGLTKSFDAFVKKSLVIATSSIIIEPERLKPGDNANIKVVMENPTNSKLKDISISLDFNNVPFSPIGTTSEKKIKELSSGKTDTVVFNIIVNPDAESKVYKIPMALEYLDELGKEFTKNEVIGIIVDEKPNYQIDLEESEVYNYRGSGEITLSISNRGTSEIKFLTIGLLDNKKYDVVSNPRVYVGNLESDDFETVNFHIYSKSYFDIPLKVNLLYKDAYNREYDEEIIVNLPMYTRFTAKRLGLIKGDSRLRNLIVFIILFVFAFKTWKEWKRQKDIEKAVKTVLKNAWEYGKEKLRKLKRKKR